eukprot:734568-Pleurochrysis_carterae.AAC.2
MGGIWESGVDGREMTEGEGLREGGGGASRPLAFDVMVTVAESSVMDALIGVGSLSSSCSSEPAE